MNFNKIKFFFSICKKLLTDVNKRSKKHRTPIQMLVHVNTDETLEESLTKTFNLLIQYRADFNSKDESGLTVLHRAILKSNRKLVMLLLDLEEIDLTVN